MFYQKGKFFAPRGICACEVDCKLDLQRTVLPKYENTAAHCYSVAPQKCGQRRFMQQRFNR